MRQRIGMCIAGILVMGAGMATAAEEGAADRQTQTKAGVVVKVDVDVEAIVVMVTREMTFAVTEETKVLQEDALKDFTDIKVGNAVSVEYFRASADKRVATVITITGEAAAPVAPKPAAAVRTQTKTGPVTKVDADAKAIVVMVTRELTFTITGDTKILQEDAPKTLEEIKVGDTVNVLYAFAGQDKRVALTVTITTPAQ